MTQAEVIEFRTQCPPGQNKYLVLKKLEIKNNQHESKILNKYTSCVLTNTIVIFMNIKLLSSLAFIAQLTTSAFGQMSNLNIPADLRLPRDSVVKSEILTSLDQFLFQIQKSNNENTYVLKAELLETSVLMDEMKNLETNNILKKENFFKPYLINLTIFNDSNCLAQIAYMGSSDGIPSMRASFILLGQKRGDQFYFHSPLKQNTVAWKTKQLDNVTIYFKKTINESNARKYFEMVELYDKKLNAPVQPTDFYCADNFHEVLQLVGVDYKSEYNGYARNALTSMENGHNLNVNGNLSSDFTKFDPHDLWHERLHQVISIDVINRPVDEGTAYLYGGSWGLSWNEILNKFKFMHTPIQMQIG
jgi:hypothetical protein